MSLAADETDGYSDKSDTRAGYESVDAYAGDDSSRDGRYRRNRARDLVVMPEYDSAGEYRQPTAMVVQSDTRILVCTKLTGEIHCVDPQSATSNVEFGPSDFRFDHLVALDDQLLLASDAAGEQLVVLRKRVPGKGWEIVKRLDAPGEIGGLCHDAASGQIVASGIWSRILYRWKFHPSDGSVERLSTIDLPFAGGAIALGAGQNHLFVADAFGRNLAVVDLVARTVWAHTLFDHNIKSMFVDTKVNELVYAHQLLNEFIPSLQGEITWGGMLSNNARQLKLELLLDPSNEDIHAGNVFTALGFTGQGGGQPTCLKRLDTGGLVATLGGSSKLAIQRGSRFEFDYYPTGLYPVQCEVSNDQQQIFVLNQFGDSLSVFETETGAAKHIPLGSVRTPTLTERGEQLFHDSRLSHDGWMSCESCHSRGHTNGHLNDNLSDYTQGTPKRILSLLGQAETAPYSWLGAQKELAGQVRHSIKSTMASDHGVRESDVAALTSFVTSLPRPPSVGLARIVASERAALKSSRAEQRGAKLFNSLSCANCHTPPLFTSKDVFDVSLEDEQGQKAFNPPSLLGVSQRESALFHDGRARSLEDVLVRYKHQIVQPLSPTRAADLVAYLRSL